MGFERSRFRRKNEGSGSLLFDNRKCVGESPRKKRIVILFLRASHVGTEEENVFFFLSFWEMMKEKAIERAKARP